MSISPLLPFSYRKDRICGYCLIEISEENVKICGKCRKRAYCSLECQRKDWHTQAITYEGQRSQGHKNWCGVNYGEEGIDWKVISIPGKGKGIEAMNNIKKWTKIIIDPFQITSTSHSAIRFLMPQNENLDGKFQFNSYALRRKNESLNLLGLKIARVNHSCSPNTNLIICDEFGVKILYANQDINEGDEITISYITPEFSYNFDKYASFERAHNSLSRLFFFTCPINSFCRSKEYNKFYNESKIVRKNVNAILFKEQNCINCGVISDLYCTNCLTKAWKYLNRLKELEKIVKFSCEYRSNCYELLLTNFAYNKYLNSSIIDFGDLIKKQLRLLNVINNPKSKDVNKLNLVKSFHSLFSAQNIFSD